MDLANLLISLISGAIGGNVAGAAMPQKNLGTLVNSIVGLLGGGVGDFILKALGVLASTSATTAANGAPAATGSEFDLATLLANIGISGVSGGALTAIVALLKDVLQKK